MSAGLIDLHGDELDELILASDAGQGKALRLTWGRNPVALIVCPTNEWVYPILARLRGLDWDKRPRPADARAGR